MQTVPSQAENNEGPLAFLMRTLTEIQKEAVREVIEFEVAQAKQSGAEEAANEILDCPYVINVTTCPNRDFSRANEAPDQVVGTIHMSLRRYNKIKSLLSPHQNKKEGV